jgi:hypothetical protein
MDADVLASVLKKAVSSIDNFEIKTRVDDDGIDEFIWRCAGLSASTGFTTGFGGGLSMAFLIGVDLSNYLYQQVRITMGVIYARTGNYDVEFEEVLACMAVALGVRAAGSVAVYGGIQAGKSIGTNLAERETVRLVAGELVKRLPASTVSKCVPILGGLIGAGFNLATLVAYGKAVLAIDDAFFATGGT